jgi:hypothetical protein
MAVRPNFDETVRLNGQSMTVTGVTDDEPPHPFQLLVFLEQNGHVEGTTVHRFTRRWETSLPSEGFQPGSALAFGVEVRTTPFQAATWSQVVTIA